jgi:hypothetical protein
VPLTKKFAFAASIIYRFFSDTFASHLNAEGKSIMDMHAIAGVAVLLVLVAASAYRDALRNDPLSPLRRRGSNRVSAPQMEEVE